jgi:hypothetical protein
MNHFDYWLTKVCMWLAHKTWLIANSTGCNPIHTDKYYKEWQAWVRYFELLEVNNRGLRNDT